MSDISEDEKRPKRGQFLFAVLFLVFATLLLASIGDQTKWLKGKPLFAQPRFWPAVGVGGMVLFTGLHMWMLPRRPRILPRWMRESDWWQWAESFAWLGLAVGLSFMLGPLLAAPLLGIVAIIRWAWLYLHKSDRKEALIWLSVIEWAAWFLTFVFLVPVLGYLPVSVIFAPLLTWRMGYRSRLLLGISVVFAALVVVVFKSFLQVRIPGAMIYEYLPGALRSFFILNF